MNPKPFPTLTKDEALSHLVKTYPYFTMGSMLVQHRAILYKGDRVKLLLAGKKSLPSVYLYSWLILFSQQGCSSHSMYRQPREPTYQNRNTVLKNRRYVVGMLDPDFGGCSLKFNKPKEEVPQKTMVSLVELREI